jgi:hypothetical protein
MNALYVTAPPGAPLPHDWALKKGSICRTSHKSCDQRFLVEELKPLSSCLGLLPEKFCLFQKPTCNLSDFCLCFGRHTISSAHGKSVETSSLSRGRMNVNGVCESSSGAILRQFVNEQPSCSRLARLPMLSTEQPCHRSNQADELERLYPRSRGRRVPGLSSVSIRPRAGGRAEKRAQGAVHRHPAREARGPVRTRRDCGRLVGAANGPTVGTSAVVPSGSDSMHQSESYLPVLRLPSSYGLRHEAPRSDQWRPDEPERRHDAW